MNIMVNVTIYTAPSCGACTAAKRAMTAHGIDFTEVDTSHDAAARAYLRDDLGYVTAPVTALTYKNGRVHTWSGFDLDQIRHTQQVLADEGPGLAQPTHPTGAHTATTTTAPHVAGAA